MAQDPLIQMQQQELQLKGQEVQRKAAKDAQDVQIAMAKLQVEKDKIGVDAHIKAAQISAQMNRPKSGG